MAAAKTLTRDYLRAVEEDNRKRWNGRGADARAGTDEGLQFVWRWQTWRQKGYKPEMGYPDSWLRRRAPGQTVFAECPYTPTFDKSWRFVLVVAGYDVLHEGVLYTATVRFRGEEILRAKRRYTRRADAQVAAEAMLERWLCNAHHRLFRTEL